MRGRSRGRNNKNKRRGSRATQLCGGVCGVGLALAGLGAAKAQETAPTVTATPAVPTLAPPAIGGGALGGALGGFGGAPGGFTSPIGAYGAPLPSAPPTLPTATEGLVAPAIPPAFLITPSIELGEAFNDNVNLAPKGSTEWDFITTISPGISITAQGARSNLAVTYDPQELLFARTSPSNVLQQRLLGAGTAELWNQVLFIEGTASISQAFARTTGPVAPTTLTTNGNLQTVYTETASPYLRQHLGSYADSESRYVFTSTSTSSGTNVGGTAVAIAPEMTHELRQTFVGGEAFGRLGWQLLGDWTRLERGQATGDPFSGLVSKDELIRGDLKYPIYQALSAIGGVGYERIIDPTLTTAPKGVIWNAGLSYQPNPLVALSLTYGERFDTSDIEFNATYNLDPQLHLAAIYTSTVQTGQSQFAGNTASLAVGPDGTLIDTRTGQPFVQSNGSGSFGITSGSFLAKTGTLNATYTQLRDTYTATVYETKISGNNTINPALAAATSTVTAQRIFGGSLGWTHLLRPDLTANAGGTYYHTLFLDGSGRRDNAYTLSIGLTYTLSPTATATLTLSRYDLQSNIEINSLTNDIVMASIRKQF
jgi:uncharacterized protein (PEP-CTERM system associated)